MTFHVIILCFSRVGRTIVLGSFVFVISTPEEAARVGTTYIMQKSIDHTMTFIVFLRYRSESDKILSQMKFKFKFFSLKHCYSVAKDLMLINLFILNLNRNRKDVDLSRKIVIGSVDNSFEYSPILRFQLKSYLDQYPPRPEEQASIGWIQPIIQLNVIWKQQNLNVILDYLTSLGF